MTLTRQPVLKGRTSRPQWWTLNTGKWKAPELSTLGLESYLSLWQLTLPLQHPAPTVEEETGKKWVGREIIFPNTYSRESAFHLEEHKLESFQHQGMWGLESKINFS